MKLSKDQKKALGWIFRAQDATSDGGVSKFYEIGIGWSKESYKEVSGYIVPTLLNYYHKTKDKEVLKRAKRIADWELSVQEKCGKWEYVFDTGQIVLGLIAIYKETQNKRYLDSVIKACNWLVKVQSSSGNWNKFEFALGIKNKILRLFGVLGHSYNSRTAWALLEAWRLTKNEQYKVSAVKNLDWVLRDQLNNSYYSHSHGYLHYLVYTARGLLESGIILNEPKYNQDVQESAID